MRGVAVSSNIIRTLTERDWIKVVGHKEVPGRPSLYATTRQFLDYFSLKSLADLPGSEVFEGLEDNEQPPATATLEAPSDDDRAIETAEQKREENE